MNSNDDNDEASREMKSHRIIDSKHANERIATNAGKSSIKKPVGSSQASSSTSDGSLQIQNSESRAITGANTKDDKKGLLEKLFSS